MLEQLTALIPKIAALAGQIEANRALPDSLVGQLKQHQAFRLLLPQSLGGANAAFEDYIKLIERMAEADASTAWCINQGSVIALSTLWLPATLQQAIWDDPNAAVANGPPFTAKLERDDEGYRVSGHWGFSSGCQHATWMMGPARLTEDDRWRMAFFHPDQVTFHDNWQVPGLRGTGSFEFTCDNLSLPAQQVADQSKPCAYEHELTRIPQGLLFGVSFAALALGVAAGASADARSIAQGKLPRYARQHLRDDPDAQRLVGLAAARARAAKAYLNETVSAVLHHVRRGNAPEHQQRADLRLAATHVIRESAAVVDLSYRVAGTTGIYQNELLQRRVQDMRVITQHVQARDGFYRLVGRYLISGDYELGPMS